MGGVRSITQKSLHGMSRQRTVSVQEAVHMVDSQELVLCSDYVTHVSLQQAVSLKSKDDNESKDLVSRYRNCPKKYHNMSLETYLYEVFCRETLHDKGQRRSHKT